MNTTILLDRIVCTGCLACLDNCPAGAIIQQEDEYGFVYPAVLEDRCIGCKRCINNCHLRRSGKEQKSIKSFAAYAKDSSLYNNSSSGGAFAVFAKTFLENGGVVYGAAYSPKYSCVKHIRITEISELHRIQGSKYVQSNTEGIYKAVINDIKSGKKVLFSGTPCQIAALYNVVDTKWQKELYTIEVICHGVSNNRLLRKDVETYRSDSYPSNIAFRHKSTFEKSAFILKLYYPDNKTIKVSANRDFYYRLYVEGKSFRDSCYSCNYSKEERVADITIGDCSTYKDYESLTMENALSTVIINNDKGQYMWGNIEKQVFFMVQDMQKEFKCNGQLNHPTPYPNNRFEILNDCKNLPLDKLHQKYVKFDISSEVRNFIKSLIPIKIRVKIKKIIRK